MSSDDENVDNQMDRFPPSPLVSSNESIEIKRETEDNFDAGEMFVNRSQVNGNIDSTPPNDHNIHWGWSTDDDDGEIHINNLRVFENDNSPPNIYTIYWIWIFGRWVRVANNQDMLLLMMTIYFLSYRF